MISKTMESALSRQANREFYSAYLYLAMSSYYDSINLAGFGQWLRVQAREELEHAMKIYDYIGDAGGRPVMEAIEAPQKDWNGAKVAFAEVLAHEQAVTGMINDLMDLAIKENDYATREFLGWFVTEQVEEEKNAGDILVQIEKFGDAAGPLFSLDRSLAARQ